MLVVVSVGVGPIEPGLLAVGLLWAGLGEDLFGGVEVDKFEAGAVV